MTIAQAISGTWAMAKGDDDWVDRLPMDTNAVFASFLAIPLSLPAIVLAGEAARQYVVTTGEAPADMLGPVGTAVSGVVATIIIWAAVIALLSRMSAKAGAGWRISPLLIGYNWSRFIVSVISGLGCVIAIALSALPLFALFVLGATVLGVWLEIGVYKRALSLQTGQAIGLLLLVFLVRFAINAGVGIVAAAF